MTVRRVLFLQATDEEIINAQACNVKKILARWPAGGLRAASFHFRAPDPAVAENPIVDLIKLPTNRTWLAHALVHLQRDWAAIFAPGLHTWFDAYALMVRAAMRRSIPILTTYEGLLAPKDDGGALARAYGEAAGHPVHCQVVSDGIYRRLQWMHRKAARIVAISPFLKRMAELQHQPGKIDCVPLGVESALFESVPAQRADPVNPLVICAGSVAAHKRPEVFLKLARRYRQARFVWYGDGPMRAPLLKTAMREGVANFEMPGPAQPAALAEAYAEADVFVLPSLAEGVPKVTQEAATAGLPIVIFNHYEAPTVEDGRNGFQVGCDEAFVVRIGQLLDDADLRQAMGRESRVMSADWNWNRVAPRWASVIAETTVYDL